MKKPETKFRARFVAKLKKIPKTVLFSIQQLSISGTPDILACVNGVFVAMELKATARSSVTKLQSYNLQRIQEAEGVALIVHPGNMEESLDLLSKIASGGSYGIS
jgi:Holliday junction resolvase